MLQRVKCVWVEGENCLSFSLWRKSSKRSLRPSSWPKSSWSWQNHTQSSQWAETWKNNAISHFFIWIVLQDAFCLFCMIIGPLCKWVGLLCWFCLVFPLVYNILTPQWIISSKDFIVSMIYLYKEGLEKLKQIWLKQLLILLLTLTELRARSCITPIKILGWT